MDVNKYIMVENMYMYYIYKVLLDSYYVSYICILCVMQHFCLFSNYNICIYIYVCVCVLRMCIYIRMSVNSILLSCY